MTNKCENYVNRIMGKFDQNVKIITRIMGKFDQLSLVISIVVFFHSSIWFGPL